MDFRCLFFLSVLVISLGVQADTSINACQALSSANTVYALSQNVSASGANCFSVTATNVTLKCAAFTVFGDRTGGMAGLLTNRANTTITNCTITNFDYDVWLQFGSNNSVVQQSTLDNASTAGVFLDQTGVSTVNFTTMTNNSNGVFFNASLDNVVANSTITASINNDVFSNNSARNSFVNTTFNKSFVGWGDSGSNFTVSWMFNILTQNATGGVIISASVNMTNATSTAPQVQVKTDSNGNSGYQVLAEYLQAGNQVYGVNTTNYSPYNITGNVANYYFIGSSVQNSTNVSVTSSQSYTLVLAGNWALIQGNFNGNITLSNAANMSFNDWLNSSPYGNVYVLPHTAGFNLTAFTALTRNSTGAVASDDFADADTLLNLTSAVDSNLQVFGGGSTAPSQTTTFTPHGYSVANVPYVNTSNSSNFITGILWDASSTSEYSVASKPTLVYATQVNRSHQGMYGVHDYEVRVPVTLASYFGGSVVDLYVELK